jgi:hypothetical protein
LRVFRHMGLACISLSTFFKHQRVSKPWLTITQITKKEGAYMIYPVYKVENSGSI